MALDLQQAAKMLGVSPATVRRWARQGRLGVMRPSGEFRFEEAELGQWARNQGLSIGAGQATATPLPVDPEQQPLIAAVSRGHILHKVPGVSAGEVLSNLVELAPLEESCDRLALLEQLQGRERLASTALGHGVALPHPRTPSKGFVQKPMVVIAMLDGVADWKALDNEPVHTAVLLLSPSPKEHLSVLSRIAFVLRDAAFVDALRNHASAEDLLALMAKLEDGFGQ
ncbi:MAG: PTS sugar transporter subunit IIA [Planctomycetota bacterium]|nr:PTS sugar transporter subunit IIA [Planctomycetota bacterium]MDA1113671.1 PTS sugar transporter subunit IIA [Planctomycetota bacterium]